MTIFGRNVTNKGQQKQASQCEVLCIYQKIGYCNTWKLKQVCQIEHKVTLHFYFIIGKLHTKWVLKPKTSILHPIIMGGESAF